MSQRHRLASESGDQGGEEGPEGVAHPSHAREGGVVQLVPRDQHAEAGARPHHEGVVSAGGGQTQERRSDPDSGGGRAVATWASPPVRRT
ncbi:hypothetical protein [Streptomyces globisporus]|uniref:hypothetical protein n=1 Tax=Streptomyces globisporus TaxID=1908 RepID=UPI0004C6A1CE|nr:hypothetical protein [Streptomyces globisporus]